MGQLNRAEYLQALGCRLKAARKQAGYTQQTVIDLLGGNIGLSRYEAGLQEPGAWLLYQLSELYRVALPGNVGKGCGIFGERLTITYHRNGDITVRHGKGSEEPMNDPVMLLSLMLAAKRERALVVLSGISAEYGEIAL